MLLLLYLLTQQDGGMRKRRSIPSLSKQHFKITIPIQYTVSGAVAVVGRIALSVSALWRGLECPEELNSV